MTTNLHLLYLMTTNLPLLTMYQDASLLVLMSWFCWPTCL
jgi:hypothetical protein